MDLTTQCPQCGATFTATLEQLQLRKGYIRCINCAHIFDGYEAVVPPESKQPRSAPQTGWPRPAAPAAQRPAPGRDDTFTISSPSGAAGRRAEPVIPQIRLGRSHDEADASAGDPLEPGPEPVYAEPRPGHEPPLPDFLAQDERRHGSAMGRVFWGVLAVAGLAAALTQLAYIYRVQLASNAPLLRPTLERACASLHCTVDYPRRIQDIAIMDSSLQAAPGQPQQGPDSRLMLSVVLRNSYDKPQQWPTLSLELVDFPGGVAARRTLPPQAYLPASALQGPFAAQSEIRFTVPVTVAGVKINGYQLAKFFP